MLRAIAIDDEPNALEVISLHCRKLTFVKLEQCFRSPLDAINWLQHHAVDVVFLDINMPELSGLKFRQLLGEGVPIIFTTAYSEYAAESYNQDAIDYLLKPITFDRFLKAILKVQRRVGEAEGMTGEKPELIEGAEENVSSEVYVKSGTKLYKLKTNDILYLEKDGNYVTFHTKDRKVLSRQNMSQVLNLLPEKAFLRVHKSYIVALQHIEIVETHQLTIQGKRIPIAKTYRPALMERLGIE